MASIKIIFRESIVEGKMGSCFIQIIHQRKIGIDLRTLTQILLHEFTVKLNGIRLTMMSFGRRIIPSGS